jgi:hypothetical protein
MSARRQGLKANVIIEPRTIRGVQHTPNIVHPNSRASALESESIVIAFGSMDP